jgi:nucleoside recognition membrane protein YjiH
MNNNASNTTNGQTFRSGKNVAKMWIFTIIGIIYFLIPFKVDGETTMWISFIEGKLMHGIPNFALIVTYLIVLSAGVSVVFSTVLKGKLENDFLKGVFEVGWMGIAWRVAGSAMLIMSYHQLGPEYIWSDYTGGLMVFELIPMLFLLFLLAMPLISLLTDFGGLELLGGLLKPLFKPLFKLSGKSAVLSLVSYIGSGTTGMIVTDGAHKRGVFTTREANIIVFGFAIVSFPVTYAYPTGIAGLEVQYFPALVICLIICTVLSTVLLSRIPPLSKKPNTYYDGTPYEEDEKIEGRGLMSVAYEEALKKAESAPAFTSTLKHGLLEFADFIIAVFPMIMVIATAVLAISEYTSIFNVIAAPIAPILSAMGLPEATQAAPSFILGFADLFLPFIGAATVTSQLTKFVICAVAIIQMYCMSEGAVVLMKSSMKINFKDIVVIFLIRTLISLPIAYYLAVFMGIPA